MRKWRIFSMMSSLGFASTNTEPFNSPVWFNVGLYQQYGIGTGAGEGNYFYNRETGKADRAATQYEYPQGSACFIQSVDDTMEDIMRWRRARRCYLSTGAAPAATSPVCAARARN
jgi:ribonucleoside-diphosphate reductase alpha chain